MDLPSQDCSDFQDICGINDINPPNFLIHFGLSTWTDFTVAILIGLMALMGLLFIVLFMLKFGYSEKATKFEKIFHLYNLTLLSNVKF